MDEERIIRRVVVRGRVQGVAFRAWTEREAAVRSLEGWVRNRRDGAVEAVFAGPRATVAVMIAACRKGPLLARVEALDESAATADALALRRPGEAFSVLPTA